LKIYSISYQPNQVQSNLTSFLGKIASFLGKYLGLPVHTRKPRKVEVQPLVENIGKRLPGWEEKLCLKQEEKHSLTLYSHRNQFTI